MIRDRQTEESERRKDKREVDGDEGTRERCEKIRSERKRQRTVKEQGK